MGLVVVSGTPSTFALSVPFAGVPSTPKVTVNLGVEGVGVLLLVVGLQPVKSSSTAKTMAVMSVAPPMRERLLPLRVCVFIKSLLYVSNEINVTIKVLFRIGRLLPRN